MLVLVKNDVSGTEVGVLGGVGVGVLGVGVGGFAVESSLRRVCSAIMRIRCLWNSAANLSFSSFSLQIRNTFKQEKS